MAGTGGARPGSGRKSKVDEEKVKKLAQAAIIKKYGSLKNGFSALLRGRSDMMKRFVWEHAVGKPREKMDIDANVQLEQITGMQFK